MQPESTTHTQTAWVQSLLCYLSTCLTLGKLLLSAPLFYLGSTGTVTPPRYGVRLKRINTYKVQDLRLRGWAGEVCAIIIVAIVLKSPGSSFEKHNLGRGGGGSSPRRNALQPGLCWAEPPRGLWVRSHVKGLWGPRERSSEDPALLTEVLISSQGQWRTLVST